MNYKTFSNLNDDIRKNLYKIQSYDFDLIVGIPRSGMIPAYMIGLYLNAYVTDLNGLIENKSLSKGITRKAKCDLSSSWDAKKILLVDDSIQSGNSMKKRLEMIPDELKNRITTLAIYSTSIKRDDIDIFFEYLPKPRVFEWNIFHKELLSNACVDIDGVLCIDPTEEENDDGLKYINFLKNAKPLILPTYKIHSLVTSRLEKYRKETQEWLAKYNIKYDNLIMLDLPSKEERQKLNAKVTHKANYYSKSNTFLFIESNYIQAMKISKLTGKIVYCTNKNMMITPSLYDSFLKDKQTFKKRVKISLLNLAPNWIKSRYY